MSAFEEAAELLEELVALPASERESALVRRASVEEVRALVRRMLAGEARPLAGLDAGVIALGGGPPEGPASFAPRGPRYRVIEELARGGMGVVLRGRDEELGRDVAIKVLRRGGDASARARFVEEAQVAGQLQHPGVVPIYEMGTDAEGRPFFAMKLIEGETLATRLAARSSPADGRARLLAVFLQVCQTMAYAHARGVIHRDLKPSNVMVGSFGEVQVLDWGLAKVLDAPLQAAGVRAPEPARLETVRTRDSSGSASLSGSVMGTPGYMPPEQARGEVERLDRRADVFALGAILCEILCAEPPFPGAREEALRRARAGDLAPARARLEACAADPVLVALARDALAPEADARPADAGVLAQRIQDFQARSEERLRAAELAAETARVKAVEERRARRLTALLALGGVGLVLLVAGTLGWRAHERGQRVSSLTAEVGAALDAAAARVGTARAAPVGEDAPWVAAGIALASVERLLASGETEPGVRVRQADLSAAFSAERAAHVRASADWRRDRELLARLEDIRAPKGDGLDPYDYARMESGYRAVFREHGIDPEQPDQARAALAASSVARELAQALEQWALCHMVLREAAGAREPFSNVLLELAEHADPDPTRARIRRAVREGDRESLREVARGELDALAPESLFALAIGLRRLDDLGTAIDVLRRGVRRHRGDYWLQLNLAIFLRAEAGGTARTAVPYFHAALALRPNSLEVRHLLGQNLADLGELDEALRLFEELLVLEPGQGHWRAHLGALLADRNEYGQAIPMLEDAVELAPDDPFALNQLGNAYLADGRPWRALEPLRHLWEREPEADNALTLADAYLLIGDDDRAWPLMLQYTPTGSKPGVRYYNLANLADERGPPGQAREFFEQAMVHDPSLAQPHCNLARLLRDQGRYAEARLEYRRCQDLGRAQAGFAYPVREWIAEVERYQLYADELEHYLEQGIDVDATEEALEIAYVALQRGWNRAASGWFAQIIATLSPSSRDFQHHTSFGAEAAARAAAGLGEDAPADASERVRLVVEAVRLLRLSLSRLMAVFEASPTEELQGTREWLQDWRVDPSLAALRDDGRVELPPEVRAACRALWADIDAALARIDQVQATLD